ncbi:MAG: hypothetical protein DRO99_02160 [Candidatus Aenigmatarchaeota archaeon]|nr:MAG: hypothetical protein DRO99_02160 [Candidatus Aenigmarchaeota archaeon]
MTNHFNKGRTVMAGSANIEKTAVPVLIAKPGATTDGLRPMKSYLRHPISGSRANNGYANP